MGKIAAEERGRGEARDFMGGCEGDRKADKEPKAQRERRRGKERRRDRFVRGSNGSCAQTRKERQALYLLCRVVSPLISTHYKCQPRNFPDNRPAAEGLLHLTQ